MASVLLCAMAMGVRQQDVVLLRILKPEGSQLVLDTPKSLHVLRSVRFLEFQFELRPQAGMGQVFPGHAQQAKERRPGLEDPVFDKFPVLTGYHPEKS